MVTGYSSGSKSPAAVLVRRQTDEICSSVK